MKQFKNINEFTEKKKTDFDTPRIQNLQLIDIYNLFLEKFIIKSKNKKQRQLVAKIKKFSKKNPKTAIPTKQSFYQKIKLLEKGQFGSVWLAVQILTNKLVAIKQILKIEGDENLKENVWLELMTFKQLRFSKYIVHLLEFYETPKHYNFVMDYIKNGSLLNQIQSHGPIDEERARQMFRQICLGVRHIHSKNIIHRDIKLENVVINDDVYKICDFGVSRFLPEKPIYEKFGTV